MTTQKNMGNPPQAGSGPSAGDASNDAVLNVLRKTRASMVRVRDRLSEPLAIIGVGCRFPQSPGPAAYWSLLTSGQCAIRETPAGRWPEALKATEAKQRGKVTANRGGYLDQIDGFDAAFFGISGREAAALDPQQRLLLEVAWETLEHAGINPHTTRGSRTGVFAGICSNDYLQRLSAGGYGSIGNYHGAGNAHGAAAGRLNYFMNWSGPSAAVDTACSSSLTALHLATRSIRYGDCDMALVAGVNLILSPELSISLSQAGMLSPEGLCHTFDAAADGFVRGEGCGAVLLKRLSKAVADKDRILCVVRGTACNQDGRSNGLTAPNGIAQQEVIRAALADARTKPAEVDYIEAHGTGTPLGDPIEMSALQGVFAEGRTGANPLRIGSVKTNIGHLEGAAGIAGVIKVALALHHGQIPPHLHFAQPSPHIDWNWPVAATASAHDWPRNARPRVAGVSSFGFGGSNAHVVMAEAPASAPAATPVVQPVTPGASTHGDNATPHLLAISARTQESLSQLAADYAQVLRSDEAPLTEVCQTAATGRAQFEYRIAVTGDTAGQLATRIGQATATDATASAGVWRFETAPQSVSCQAVYQRFDSFRNALDKAVEAINLACEESGFDLVDASAMISGVQLNSRGTRLQQFALMHATASMWKDWGAGFNKIEAAPGAEHAAACIAGVFPLNDAARILCGQLEVEASADNLHAEAPNGFKIMLGDIAFAPSDTYRSLVSVGANASSAGYWIALLQSALSGIDNTRVAAISSPDVSLRITSAAAGDPAELLQQLAALYRAGVAVDWQRVYPQKASPATLPVYRFDRKRHWFDEEPASGAVQHPTAAAAIMPSNSLSNAHPLLGRKLDIAGEDTVYETDLNSTGYLNDHCINNRVLFPATGFLELAMAAGREERAGLSVSDLQIHRPIIIDNESPRRVQVVVRPADTSFRCTISVRNARGWRIAAQCTLGAKAPVNVEQRLAADRNGHSFPIETATHYAQCRAAGLQYGPAFQGVLRLDGAPGEAWGEVELPPGLDADGYVFHPAALDACLQVAAGAIPASNDGGWLPTGIDHYDIYHCPGDEPLNVYVRMHEDQDTGELLASIVMHSRDGELVAAIDNLRLKPLAPSRPHTATETAPEAVPDTETIPETPHQADGRAAQILAAPVESRGELLQSYLHERVADIMGMTVEEIPADVSLDSLGMDSMMAFELRDELERDFNLLVPMELFLQGTTLEQFSRNAGNGLALKDDESTPAPGFPPGELGDGETWIEGSI